jgi:hypothetical protein
VRRGDRDDQRRPKGESGRPGMAHKPGARR